MSKAGIDFHYKGHHLNEKEPEIKPWKNNSDTKKLPKIEKSPKKENSSALKESQTSDNSLKKNQKLITKGLKKPLNGKIPPKNSKIKSSRKK